MKSNVFLVTLQEFFHNKTLDPDQECETCDSGRAARKKCIECTDWMCNQCCAMHLKVDTHLQTLLAAATCFIHSALKCTVFT